MGGTYSLNDQSWKTTFKFSFKVLVNALIQIGNAVSFNKAAFDFSVQRSAQRYQILGHSSVTFFSFFGTLWAV